MAVRPAVFTIPAHLPFLDTLSAGLNAEAAGDPLALARSTVLLPTRRAVRALREAFLRAGGGKAQLLPRLVPVGDLDAEELAFLADEGPGGAAAESAPAVPELRRRLMLARLVLAWGRARGSGPHTAGQAAPLAAALARFLDEVQTEGGHLAALDQLVPEEHAAHWQEILQFLQILREHWPAALAELGALDPAARRNLVLQAQAAAWRRDPPAQPVVAAGITGSVPAVAELLAVIAGLPNGRVVLPGFAAAEDEERSLAMAADPAHPQHVMLRLLERLEVAPAAVRPWPSGAEVIPSPPRSALVAAALLPAAASHHWRSGSGIDGRALEGLTRIDCPGPQEEAGVVALLLRQRLERSGETAALVTPDRALARRVAAELRRWGIEVDDSAGVPLALTPPGVFLRLLLDAAAEDFAPLPLLAALKHPLAAGGLAPEAFRARVRRLEIEALRGPRPQSGIRGLEAVLPRGDAALRDLVRRLAAALTPLAAALAGRGGGLPTLVAAHIRAAEALAASDAEPGAARLWREPAGEAAAEFLAELIEAAAGFPPLDGHDYPALFESLIAGPVVRQPYDRHPRLFIWGLLEARLQHADLLVLGGLNEGVWPPAVESDPWLSRPMRRQFGLPPPERRIGIAAHDFAQAMGAREVVLTRAARVEGTPTVPSRWLLRLDTVLRAADLQGRLGAAPAPLDWQRALDEPARHRPVKPPEPRPPVTARPRRLSVTAIETWMRDPYAIYARHILRLKALDPIDADPGAAERGEIIHAALDEFLRAFPDDLPADAAARLVAIGRAAFGEALKRPGVAAFWWPRFERIAAWFAALEAERRPLLAASHTEQRGRLVLDGPAGPFELTGKADRIDRLRGGGIVLIDYKTGGVPSAREVEQGYAPQLPLEAAMAEAGAFPGIAPAVVTALQYWRLGGGDPPGEAKTVASDATLRAVVDDALAGLQRLIAAFDDPATPYRAVPLPERAPRYSDYAHLARIKEWSLSPERGE